MYFFTLYQAWKRMFWVETCILQCISNSGRSVIWLRKQNPILAWCHLLIFWHRACSNPNSDCCCAAKRIDSDCISGISSSKSFLLLFKAPISSLLNRCGWSAQQWEYACTLTKQSQCFLICLHQAYWKSCHLQWCHERSTHYPGNHHAAALYLHRKHKSDTNISSLP